MARSLEKTDAMGVECPKPGDQVVSVPAEVVYAHLPSPVELLEPLARVAKRRVSEPKR